MNARARLFELHGLKIQGAVSDIEFKRQRAALKAEIEVEEREIRARELAASVPNRPTLA